MNPTLLIFVLLVALAPCGWGDQMLSPPETSIVSVTLNDGKMEVLYKQTVRQIKIINVPLSAIDSTKPTPLPTTILETVNSWKEIYASVDGKIQLIKTIEAEIIPEHTVPEEVRWKE